jgi:Zn-dependent M28 family amino/carboxypeptidase
MKTNISAMILVDIVGDNELRLLRESSSTDSLQELVWSIAAELGHNDTFLDSTGGHITDDHSPFLSAGIPSLDIIQHAPFPWYWHTLEDTPDKCSAESLEVVGSVLEVFLVRHFSDGFPIATAFPMPEIISVIVLFSLSVPIYWWYRHRSS